MLNDNEVIEFNRPYTTGNELVYIGDVLRSGKISGDGAYTKKCSIFFEEKYGFKKALLTTSCTDALEMAAILIDIREGDEVIAPSFTFVSTVNAFVLRGAKIRFIDSSPENPNMDLEQLEGMITNKTKAIVAVHYAGIACDMDRLTEIAGRHNLFVVEDAAQAIDSYYKGKPLGSFGHLSAFSFHETKNITCGEGGLLVINDSSFVNRAEIIREKGTNRSAFFRGEVNKYGWVDVGSSFLPSDLLAAALWAQLESLRKIQDKRNGIWSLYDKLLQPLRDAKKIETPYLPEFATVNGHIYFIVCRSLTERTNLMEHLKKNKIKTTFHYISLHSSPYYKNHYRGEELPNSDKFTNCLLRLPLYPTLTNENVMFICAKIQEFYS